MKLLVPLIFCIFSQLSFCQTQIFQGSIDDKYEITLFLNASDFNSNGSIQGLYYYESSKKMIRIGNEMNSNSKEQIINSHHLCLREGYTEADPFLPPGEYAYGFCGQFYDNLFIGIWYGKNSKHYPFKVIKTDNSIHKYNSDYKKLTGSWSFEFELETGWISINYIIDDLFTFDYQGLSYGTDSSGARDNDQILDKHDSNIIKLKGNTFYNSSDEIFMEFNNGKIHYQDMIFSKD